MVSYCCLVLSHRGHHLIGLYMDLDRVPDLGPVSPEYLVPRPGHDLGPVGPLSQKTRMRLVQLKTQHKDSHDLFAVVREYPLSPMHASEHNDMNNKQDSKVHKYLSQ